MLRASSSLQWNFKGWDLDLGYSWLNFLDGRIQGHQIFGGVSVPTEFGLMSQDLEDDNQFEASSEKSQKNVGSQATSLRIPVRDRMELIPSLKVFRTSGITAVGGKKMAAHLDMIGLEFHRKIRFSNFYTLFHYYTSVAGHDGGFAIGGLGFNYHLLLSKRLSLIPQVAMTFGGGSTVPSGGGLFFESQLGLDFKFTKSFALRGGASYTVSPSDIFDLPSVFAQGIFIFDSARAPSTLLRRETLKLPQIQPAALRLGASNQHYFFQRHLKRESAMKNLGTLICWYRP